jgi:hypothetical protein
MIHQYAAGRGRFAWKKMKVIFGAAPGILRAKELLPAFIL